MEDDIIILHLEDSENDSELICSLLDNEGIKYSYNLVKTKEEFENCIKNCEYNLILSDYAIPSYDGLSALKLANEIAPDVPFIFVSGTIGEEIAISSLVNGATDYILKNNMKRLGTAVRRAFKEYKESQDKIAAENALIESERKFRNVFENATIGIYRSTPEGKLLMANEEALKIFGYNSIEDLLTINLNTHCYANKETRKKFKAIIEREGYVRGFEEKIRKKDGTEVFTRENATVVKDKNNKVLFYDGTIEDISQRKKTEQAIIEARIKAEQSEKIKTWFLQQMSHELRTPMNVIVNLLQLVKEETQIDETSDLVESFDIIDSSAKRMTRTIDQILNMSELQAQSYEPKRKTIDLYNEILVKIYSELRKTANEKGLELKLHKEATNQFIFADEYSVSQIFYNLIDNAIKFTNEGKIDVTVFNENDNYISVKIIDTGIGISKEYIKKVFDPFSQEDSGTTRKYDGTGLGLSLVKKYCELNYADIKVDSVKDKGTKFKVTFFSKR